MHMRAKTFKNIKNKQQFIIAHTLFEQFMDIVGLKQPNKNNQRETIRNSPSKNKTVLAKLYL